MERGNAIATKGEFVHKFLGTKRSKGSGQWELGYLHKFLGTHIEIDAVSDLLRRDG